MRVRTTSSLETRRLSAKSDQAHFRGAAFDTFLIAAIQNLEELLEGTPDLSSGAGAKGDA
jgi:hypothetical protein